MVTGENISSDSPVPEEKQEYLNRMSVTFWFDGDKVVGIDLLDGRMLALGT